MIDFLPWKKDLERLARDNGRLEAFLRAVPVEYCGWNRDGVKALSPGFCALLGITKVDGFSDIAAALAADDGAALEGFYDRLKERGMAFDLTAHRQDRGCVLKISGRRGRFDPTGEYFDVIWLMDVTALAVAAVKAGENIMVHERREQELYAVLNALPFPVWTRDENLDLDWCNKAYARIIDDTAAAVVADKKELPVKGGKKEEQIRLLAQRALSKNGSETGARHIVQDGQLRLFEVTETVLPEGKRLAGVAQDVTKLEQIGQDLKRLQDSNRAALEQLRTAIATFDTSTRLEFYNTACEQLWGLDGKWLNTGPKLGDILDRLRERRRLPEQADFRLFKQNWLKMFTGLLEPHEEMQYLPDGKALRVIVMPRPSGGLLMTFEDVTSRLELETSYNMLVSVQKETLDNLSEGIAVFGQDGILKLWNPTFAALWKLTPEELEGSPHCSVIVDRMSRFFPDEKREQSRKLLGANVFDRHGRKGRIERLDDSVLQFSVTPLPDGNILNVYIDITDTARVEEALLAKNRALEEAERLKADFLANVSYQLRTPLNAMMGFAELLKEQYFGKLNEKQGEYTDNIITAGKRLVSLIDDILDLSTIEAGYLKLDLVEVDVPSVLSSVADLTGEWARKQNLEIKVVCSKKLPRIVADERRLKQILLNLISNAINYSPAGGSVTVFAEMEGEKVRIGVRDTGAGIPAEDVERVFQPFEKSRNKTLIRKGGAGLGLALVKNIVELHGGSVSLESREGEGTVVTCVFDGK